MEKRKPFGDLTNLSLLGSGDSPPEPRGMKKQGSDLMNSDEKMDDFTVTNPGEPGQIETKTVASSSEKIDQEQQEGTEVSPVKSRMKTRPANLVISQQTSSLHSLEMEEGEHSGWDSSGLYSQTGNNFVMVYSIVSSPVYHLDPRLQLMSPVSPPFALTPQLLPSPSPGVMSLQSQGEDLFATLLPPGYVRLSLSCGVFLDISNDLSLRLTNPMMESSMAFCGLTQRAAIIHPRGRALVYSPRMEVQVNDEVNTKTAKLFPRDRVSFTADTCALVYSLDAGGIRSTTDVFHDLYADNIVDTMFQDSCLAQHTSVDVSRKQMYESQHWRTPEDVNCWRFGPIFVQQYSDGMVVVERSDERGIILRLKSSPGNGRLRFDSNFVQVTASLGEYSHFYVKSGPRRIHYNAITKAFVLRCVHHEVGFDEEGSLKIY